MDSGRGGGGGGGGRTPRGKKNRGGSRGRGLGQDSPRTPQSTSTAQQSPSVSSSLSTAAASPALSTPPARGGRNDEAKGSSAKESTPKPLSTPTTPVVSSTPTKSTPVMSTPQGPSAAAAVTTESSSTPSSSQEKAEPPVGTPKAAAMEASKDDVDKKATTTAPAVNVESGGTGKSDEKQPSPTLPEPGATTKPAVDNVAASSAGGQAEEKQASAAAAKPAMSAIRKEDLELAEPPTPPPAVHPQREEASTTEAKVEEALKPHQPRATAKTLVVSPPSPEERGTDAPLSVDIDPNAITSAETRASSSGSSAQRQQRHSRSGSGSVSPSGYAYALHGPVGKPGYIGGVGFSDEEGGSDPSAGVHRRESAIAAMETAVKGFTKRQWILLLIFGISDFLSAVTISLQAPFYPAEAEKKGATATEYGFVFGIFEFIVFLTSPIYGRYMNKFGPKTVFSVCILMTSVSVICFGLLDRVDDHTWFITLCFVCRIFEALGCGGFFTATFVIIACEFPESVATTFASLETFFGVGLIAGPLIGSLLWDLGGFPLPFFVVGALLLITGMLCGLVMPKIDKATSEDGVEEEGYGVWTILKFPSVALAALSIASTSMSLGFVSATLEPHIRKFGLTPFQTGLVFVVNGGVYALSAPLIGYLCDFLNRPVYITIIGNLFIFISFLLIGPAQFMPFDTILWVTIVGLLIQGLGFGCCLVSGFVVNLKDSMKNGLPDNMGTYGVASGLWTSMISLGAWVGPSLGGILYDNIGFRAGSYLILATSAVVGLTILVHTCATTGSGRKLDSESQPLLGQISPTLGRKKDVEEGGASGGTAARPATSYGSTSGGGGGDGAV